MAGTTQQYSGPITVSVTSTVKALAAAPGYITGSVASAAYNIGGVAATPTLSPGTGGFSSSQTVTVSDTSNGASIYYTLTAGTLGSVPTTNSTLYTGPITVSATSVLETLASGGGFTTSSVASATYTLTVATPTLSPAAGTYNSSQTVTISDATAGATIYYTTNGTAPTSANTTYTVPISVAATQTLKAIAYETGYSTSAVASAVYTLTVATPSFSPLAGNYLASQTVTLSDATPSASIYYTVTTGTAGTEPTTNSTHYTTPFSVSATEVVEALAVYTGYNNSAVSTAAYIIGVATPTLSPGGGTYSSIQTVTISDVTAGATIYYTTNGTIPTTSSTPYAGPITVSNPETLEAIAALSGSSSSPVASAVYAFAAPSASPVFVQQCNAYGNFVSTKSCTLSGVGAGHTLVIGVWTSATTTPSITSSAGTPTIEISDLADSPATGWLSATILSNTASGSITITAASSPIANMNIWISVSEYSNAAASPYDTSADKVLSGGYGNASISTPNFTTTASGDMLWSMCFGLGSGYANWYAGTVPITWAAVNSYGSPAYIFVEDGSAGAAGTYYGQCLTNTTSPNNGGADDAAIMTLAIKGSSPIASTPVFSPVAGSYIQVQTVTISTSTPASTIYYTTDGTTPTTNSSTYSTPVSVSATETLEAIAVATGYGNSAVGSAVYTLQPATPTFSPATGTYTAVQNVSISDSTVGTTIYYTTDGTTPTSNSPVYSSTITVSTTETLSAIATAAGFTNSAVGSAAYFINLTPATTPGFSPAAGTYSTTQSVTISDSTTNSIIYYTTNGTAPTTASPQYSAAISVSANETIEAIAMAPGYITSATGSAPYTIAAATPVFSPVAGSYVSAQSVSISDTTAGAVIYYTTNGTTPTTSSPTYTAAITVSANETLEAIAASSSYGVSATGSATYTIAAATPSFSPVAGSYASAQSVSISDTAPGATIYYTTNGATPTTNSPTYSGAIAVSANETIEAIAVAYNYLNSATGSAAYTIAAATPTFSPAAGSYGSVQSVSISDVTPGAVIYYTVNGSAPTTNSPVYSAAIAVSGSETLNAIAAAAGYGVSATGTAAYTTPPYAPVFSLAAGTYLSSQTLTISDATAGATVYYTTNSTTPTTNSTPYTAPLSITATATIEAIAASGGAPAKLRRIGHLHHRHAGRAHRARAEHLHAAHRRQRNLRLDAGQHRRALHVLRRHSRDRFE